MQPSSSFTVPSDASADDWTADVGQTDSVTAPPPPQTNSDSFDFSGFADFDSFAPVDCSAFVAPAGSAESESGAEHAGKAGKERTTTVEFADFADF